MSLAEQLSEAELARLESLHFDLPVFEQLAEQLRADSLRSQTVVGRVEPPPAGTVRPPPPVGTRQGDACAEAGLQLLAGRLGLVLLNGGMATRFGGGVKGVLDALPGRSFLSLQASRLRALARDTGRPVPLLLMNSEATDAATRRHLEENDHFGLDPAFVRCFRQGGAPRLTPEGGLYRGPDGALSIYGPGHGDFAPALRRTGALDWAREHGVEYLLMANVDNLGASPDPRLLGHFAASGAQMMVEAVEKGPGDVGGAPASVDGRVVLVEGFAFPPGFDPASIDVFNTNTLWFRADALDRDFPMQWYTVRKQVGGGRVVQFERLVGQLSWFLDTLFVRVSRDRFLPVKSPEDLAAVRPSLRKQFGVRLAAF